MEKKQNAYFGSVRFFKNMILLAVIIMIAIPTVTSVYYRRQCTRIGEEFAALQKAKEEEKQKNEIAELLDYQELYPDFYAPQSYQATERIEKTAFLTFDDGPSDRTDEVLDILAEKNVKATFYVVGHTDDESADRMRRIAEEGHTLGMHTYSHNYEGIYESVEDYLEDAYEIFCLIRDVTGQTPTCFRFPGGSVNAYNGAVYQEIIAEMMRRGFVPCDWNLSSGDATGDGVTAEEIVNNVLRQSDSMVRCFVLYHDSVAKKTSVESLRDVIDGLREQGYDLQAISPKTKPILFGYPE